MSTLKDGFSTTISFGNYPAVILKEKSVTPPGFDGGGAIDTTTMRNTALRTTAPKSLKTLTEVPFSGAFDSSMLSDLYAMINENQQITVTLPDDETIVFWGFLNTFVPGEFVEGEQPMADCSIIPTNENDSGVEVAPTLPA